MQPDVVTADDEVVDLCQRLLAIDSTNTGDLDSSKGEREAAEYVAGLLDEVGLTPQIREGAPRRTNVVARFPGADRSRGALVIHGHLDVVPAEAAEWSVHPFSAE